jgi:hypothetical protein
MEVMSGEGGKGSSYMELSGGKGLGPDGALRLAELLRKAYQPMFAELEIRQLPR